ncbi:Aste57867_15193 [Aphanomyces stellatus]|uniref:Aste57867_15193 protein n=1 Tax=Aphanomyces stellatus TaxID=120398 RepID=A0A485L3I9_9STRA|nr:hypothetical protein As57867_015137 [Aphanomyces stellatus]VFT92002.1 Aste57867_15193 [Aphanomyces stellatus]
MPLPTRPQKPPPNVAAMLTLLTHVQNGVQEVLMTHPPDPFLYMAAYLTHMMTLEVDPEDIALTKELHKKQIALGKMRKELEQLRRVRLKALRGSLACEAELCVVESIVTADDHTFLQPERQLDQEDWCPRDTTPRRDTDDDSAFHPSVRHVAAVASENKRATLEFFLPECMDALVELQKCQPSDPLHWLVVHFNAKSSHAMYRLEELKVTLGRYRWYTDHIRAQLPIAADNTKKAVAIHEDLEAQLAERNRLIKHLSIPHWTYRTDKSMKGCVEVLWNREKRWIPPDCIEPIAIFTPFQMQALHRAEIYLMLADEVAYKAKLQADLEYASSTQIQACFKCHVAYEIHKRVMATRHKAAALIQLKYERYLYAKAIRLPAWCVPGEQVVVAMSIAKRCAIWFQFYCGKDFTAGNFATVPGPLDLEAIKQRVRHDDKCAAFASDGSLKRFVPRQLSQLQPMKKTEMLADLDGLYVKKFPRTDDEVIQHAIVNAIPSNKFGTIQVVFDGTGVVEDVPVAKLSLRWKHTYDFDADAWHYVDQITKAKAPAPPLPFADDDARTREIESRKRSYALEQDTEYQVKKLASAIKLQCAFRNRKARQLFRYMLALREKEKEHQAKVDQVAANVAKKKKKKKRWFFF